MRNEIKDRRRSTGSANSRRSDEEVFSQSCFQSVRITELGNSEAWMSNALPERCTVHLSSSTPHRLVFIFIFAMTQLPACLAMKDMDEPTCEAEPGEQQICPFIFTPTLDGHIETEEWSPQKVNWQQVDASMSYKSEPPPDNDTDASFEFACGADTEYLYLAYKIVDDQLVTTPEEKDGCEFYNDDSVEVCIAQGPPFKIDKEPPGTQITIRASDVNLSPDTASLEVGGCPGYGIDGEDANVRGRTTKTGDVWNIEIAIPLHTKLEGAGGWNIKLEDGTFLGFQTAYNDRDDGTLRNHKLIWGIQDTEDVAWRKPEFLGTLRLCKKRD